MDRYILVIVGAVIATFLLAGGAVYFGEDEYRTETGLRDTGATHRTVAEVVDANNEFAFDLYFELAKGGENNLFFSPWSISTALAMTYEGARGSTAEEMRLVLHLPENDAARRPSFARIHNLLNENKDVVLETANALWAQKNYPFLDDYLNSVRTYYDARISNLDLADDPEKACEKINSWVSQRTRGKIKDLVKPNMVDTLTRLILTNAIYFKGDWVRQFDEDATHEEDFWVKPQRTVKVPMMSLTGENAKFNYAEMENFKALEMPYGGEKLSMLVLLPKSKSGLSGLEKKIGPSLFEEIKYELEERRVNIKIPKFKLETKYKLSKTLNEMGMVEPFVPSKANFSGMDGTRNLFIDFVIHKAFLEVNEEGTEAAAATGVGMKLTAISPERTFRADHPFLFLIRERETGSILFMGRVVNPSGK